ncbi:U32 family peptidase [bacterium]|nr:U32 family peptidase [bacterium]
MKLTIPANWQEDFFDKIDFSKVHEVYGKLPGDFVGGGRASVIFNKVPLSTFKNHVLKIKEMGISFNYLLNATCLDNLEFTRNGNKQIRKLMDMICNAGVDTITLALPQLVKMIKKAYPHLKVSISTNNMVDNIERVRYWEEFGIDKITLSYTDVTRNFKELKRIVKYKKCDVQLICNLMCRRHCPFQQLHSNFHSHASQTSHVNKRLPIDYYCIFCIARIFTDPIEIIRSNWIRPEDLHIYEEIGIDQFKLTERGLNTPDLAKIVSAYTNRSYDGNLFDLIPSMSKYKYITDPKPAHFLKYFSSLTKLKQSTLFKTIKTLLNMRELKDFYSNFGVSIDNKKLDGFLEYFKENPCSNTICEECKYCDKWAEKAVTVCDNADDRIKALKHINTILDDLTSGIMY